MRMLRYNPRRPRYAWDDLSEPIRTEDEPDEPDIELPTRGRLLLYPYREGAHASTSTRDQIADLQARASKGMPLFDGIRNDKRE